MNAWGWAAIATAGWLIVSVAAGLLTGPILAWAQRPPGRLAGGEPPASPRSGERSPLPGPPRLISHERLPGGYTRNLCACRCWSLADDRSRVIFRYVCGTCTRADLDQFLEETLADPP